MNQEVRDAIDRGVPFSLCCAECDAGMDIETPEQAAACGWRDIQVQDGPSFNFTGICPDCQEP